MRLRDTSSFPTLPQSTFPSHFSQSSFPPLPAWLPSEAMSAPVSGFSSDSDSSSSSAKRRRAAPFLPETVQDAPAEPPIADDHDADDADDADDAVDAVEGEEAELARMRRTSKYALFSDTFSRDQVKAERERRERRNAEEEKRRREEDALTPIAADGEEDCAEGDDDGAGMGPAAPPGHAEASAPVGGRARRAIDPKIVDDSSDEDLGSGSDSDVGAGPSLPPLAPRAAPAAPPSLLSSLPLSHEATLGSCHGAHVTALSLDPSGARFLTASVDATLQLWDFASMNSSLRAFRSVEPMGAGPVVSARFSPSGARVLVAGALSVARVLDRDGRDVAETAPGDMYIVDMARTRGHVAHLSGAVWMDDHRFATVAGDGTVRTWDVAAAVAPKSVFDGDLPRAKQVKMVKLRTTQTGRKANATALAYMNSSGRRLALGCDDRSIKIIDPNAFSLRPAAENPNAVAPGATFTSLEFGGGGGDGGGASDSLLLARSTDDALRVFDVRRLGKALAEFTDLPNEVLQTGTAFMGEGGAYFATGTSANRRGGTESARLVVYDSKKLELAWESTVEQERGSVIAVAWHHRINQFMYGCADGSVHTMYNPESSRAGVMQCLLKQVPRKVQHGFASVGVGEIYTPAALAEATSRKRPAASSAPPKDTKPDPSKLTSTFTRAFMKSKIKPNWTEDAQEALLKYHKPSDDAQPKILAEMTAEQEDEAEKEGRKSRGGNKRPRQE